MSSSSSTTSALADVSSAPTCCCWHATCASRSAGLLLTGHVSKGAHSSKTGQASQIEATFARPTFRGQHIALAHDGDKAAPKARVLRLPLFTSHSKQVEEQATRQPRHQPRRNQLEAIRSSLAQREVDTLGQRPPLRTCTRGVRGQVVHKLVPMAWEVVFPHSAGVPRGRRAGIDKTSHRPGTTEVTPAQRSGGWRQEATCFPQ